MCVGPRAEMAGDRAHARGTEVNSSGCVQGWGTNWCRVDIGGKPGYVNEVVLNRSGALFAP